MKVIIAEKPSVAREIARVVRATNRKEGYIEGSNYTVTWALGHLITAAMPEAYGFKGFHRENLPILPPVFTLIPRQVKSGKGSLVFYPRCAKCSDAVCAWTHFRNVPDFPIFATIRRAYLYLHHPLIFNNWR